MHIGPQTSMLYPHHPRWVGALLALAISALPAVAAAAPQLTTLYTFTGGADGAGPESNVISGPDGALFGTTNGIDAGVAGSIYELLPPASGSTAWVFRTLYSFTGGADGSEAGNIVADKSGNLFGVASRGGNTACSTGCGTVFELSPPTGNQTSWTEKTLYSFTGGADGYRPNYSLAINRFGQVFGFAEHGGLCVACGTAFRLTPPASGQTGWTETTLFQFAGGTGGVSPFGVPLFGEDGSIFGVTTFGGNITDPLCTGYSAYAPYIGCGMVFRLTPPGSATGAWAMTALRRFDGKDASEPVSGLVADASGNLYGTALQGGELAPCADATYPPGCGTVFEITPPADGSKVWGHKLAYAFNAGPSGDYPYTDTPIRDGGDLIVSAEGDGIATYGTIVKLTPPTSGAGRFKATVLYTFSGGADGGFPAAALLRRGRSLFGTTVEGGNPACEGGCGTVFRLTP